jgi:hypothetical protein
MWRRANTLELPGEPTNPPALPFTYEIDFRLEGGRFKVTPETVGAARLFGVETQ